MSSTRRGASPTAPERGAAVIRVLVADDHAFVRESLADLLATTDDLRVVAECADGDEVLDAVLRAEPDVVLMDVAMPRRSGLEAARDVLAERPATRVVVLSARVEPATVREARDLGAVGYLIKGDDPDEICRHIRTVAGGGTAWSAPAAAALERQDPS